MYNLVGISRLICSGHVLHECLLDHDNVNICLGWSWMVSFHFSVVLLDVFVQQLLLRASAINDHLGYDDGPCATHTANCFGGDT